MPTPSGRHAPLNALRAFEAAARHLSFKKAAVELHVTAGAVSHQVKVLEDYLGVALFRRLTRALELTPEASAMLPKVREGLDNLVEALERVDSHFDAVLLDFAMPQMNGAELAGHIRRLYAGLPLLLVTGHSDDLLLPDAVAVLRKPFQAADLG